MAPLGVAILGGGIFAREEHKPAIEASPDLELKAVWSRSQKSARSLEVDETKIDVFAEDAGAGKSLEDLLARTDIHAVIIALPIKNQSQYIRKAIGAGKHVLSEKPIAENMQEAEALLKWYRTEVDTSKTTWAVAENFRYMNSFNKGADEVKKMGRQLTFRCRAQGLVEGGKYFETEWRKNPTHQGGFLLDGGVHSTAAIRLMMGKENPLVSLSAHTAQLQPHLPPVDTIEAVAKAKNGAVGTISISFGTTQKGKVYAVGCEKGYVSVSGSTVTAGHQTWEVEDEKTGVPPEVRAWGKALVAGTANPEQSPEEAMADFELIEASLRSGEQGGKAIELKWQQV